MASSPEDKAAPIILSRIALVIIGGVTVGLMLKWSQSSNDAEKERVEMKTEMKYLRIDINNNSQLNKEQDAKDKEQDKRLDRIENDKTD